MNDNEGLSGWEILLGGLAVAILLIFISAFKQADQTRPD